VPGHDSTPLGSAHTPLYAGRDRTMGAPVGCETTNFPATMSDRTHLEALLIAINASPTALERPVCRGWVGDYQISGKLGHVLAEAPASCSTSARMNQCADGPTLNANSRSAGSHRMVTTKAACISTGCRPRTRPPRSGIASESNASDTCRPRMLKTAEEGSLAG
jgi:hypothetical protein